MSKIFILRLNSLISSKDSTLRFGDDNEIVIPMIIWNELKNYKGVPEKVKVAKEVTAYLESLDSKLLFSEGVRQENGSSLRVARRPHDCGSDIVSKLGYISDRDREIFETCKEIQRENPETEVILISKQTGTRIEARSLGINAADFEGDLFPKVKNQYSGRCKVYLTKEGRKFLEEEGKIYFKEFGFIDIELLKEYIQNYEEIEWIQNMFLEFETKGYDDILLGRVDRGTIVNLKYDNHYPCGIIPKNNAQKFLFEALMHPWNEGYLVVVKGSAGTGKTYCSLAYALSEYFLGNYKRILIAAPSETVGNEDLGFLPGDIHDKYSPYLGGFMENLNNLVKFDRKRNFEGENVNRIQDLFDNNIIEMCPIGFLRGRTITDTIFIIDETQNIEPGVILSIVSRAAEGSKFIFLGDPSQIDNPKLNERYNGLVHLSERMKGEKKIWQISFNSDESVRSELARIAIEKL